MIREEVGWGLGAEMEVVGTGKIRREETGKSLSLRDNGGGNKMYGRKMTYSATLKNKLIN